MSDGERGFWPGLVAKLTRPHPRHKPLLLEVERPVPVVERSDEAAIAALQVHPGMTALLNRFKLQRAVLQAKLNTDKFKDVTDVHSIQSGISWLGFVERQVREATNNIETRKVRVSTFDENEQFDKVLSSIESIRSTKPE
jgi:hypothetical protein